MSGGLDYDAALGFGMCVLGLSPREVWAATPRELAAAARYLGGGRRGPSRDELAALMARFPDGASTGTGGL